MDLPKLSPGKRFALPRPIGSADALLLAQLGQREKLAGKLTAIVTADANDARRLMEEMAFFAPTLRCAMFPDWETLPFDSFSPHQDLISERLWCWWSSANPGGWWKRAASGGWWLVLIATRVAVRSDLEKV